MSPQVDTSVLFSYFAKGFKKSEVKRILKGELPPSFIDLAWIEYQKVRALEIFSKKFIGEDKRLSAVKRVTTVKKKYFNKKP